MSDKVRLLRQLSIDHQEVPHIDGRAPHRRRERSFGWIAVGGMGLGCALAGALAFSLLDRTAPPAQPTRTPAPASSTGARPAAGTLTASGYVVARRVATVSAQVTGRLTAVLVEEGAVVAKNQLLAQLDPSEARVNVAGAHATYAASLAGIDNLRASLSASESRRSRAQALIGRGFISKADLDRADAETDSLRAQLAQARANASVARLDIARQSTDLSWHEVRAPFAGVVVDKAAQPGEIVSPLSSGGFTRTGIYTIVDMASLEVEVDVNETNIQRVRPGQSADVTLEAYPDLPIRGTVAAIVPTANRDRATIRVRVNLDTRDPRILPEMAAQVTFAPPSAAKPAGASE